MFALWIAEIDDDDDDDDEDDDVIAIALEDDDVKVEVPTCGMTPKRFSTDTTELAKGVIRSG